MKTSVLIGPALDWAVEIAANAVAEYDPETKAVYGLTLNGNRRIPRKAYSTDWSQGGPIIGQEWITIHAPSSKGLKFCAKDGSPLWRANNPDGASGNGPSPLIAAMRCYVASKLGDEVDIPEELK